MELLTNLNDQQKQAVTHGEGPLLIVAGAGTGKTTVVTQRVAWLISQGNAKSDEVLAVTFTDKAAGEMSERVDRLLPLGYLDLWISTFHSFCQRVLEEHAVDIGLPSDFKLLDQTAQWLLIRQNLERFDLDYYRPLGNPTKFIHALLKHFSRAKDEAISPEEYLKYVEELKLNQDAAESTGGGVKVGKHKEGDEDLSEVKRLSEVANAYHVYQQLLLENDALDFGDLINYTLKLFQKRPNVLKKYQKQFKYILVDEFQDTNWAQYELIKLLAAPKNNLTVVADDDQSIYKFRGASVSNVTQFQDDFPKVKVVSITTNYRSRQEILDLSHKFIELNNPNRLEAQSLNGQKIDKQLKAYNKGKAEINYLLYEDQYDEAAGVIKQIIELKKKDKSSTWNDFAILVRANNHADNFISALEITGLSYIYFASKGLYRKSVIFDIISFLKLLDNYHESSALWRFLNWPVFNFNEKVLIGFNYVAKRKSKSLYSVLEMVKTSQNYTESVRTEATRVLGFIEKFSKQALNKRPLEIIFSFLQDTGYLQYLVEQGDVYYNQQIKYLNQFIKTIKEYEKSDLAPSVKGFLNQLAYELESGETGKLEKDLEVGPEAVKIMTIHAAKGLEFKYVFVVNLVDKRFPSIERKDPINLPDELIKEKLPEGDIHIEEERRLMYVAMTRAKEHIYLTGARDYGGKTKKKPSRFLYELGLIEESKTVDKQIDKDLVQVKKSSKSKDHRIISYELPKKFSYTLLSNFKNCPYQFYLKYVLQLPQAGSFNFSYGNTIHLTLQKFFQLYIDKQKSQQADLFSSSASKSVKNKNEKNNQEVPSLQDLLKIYNDTWIDDWYDSEQHQQKFKESGIQELTGLYKMTVKDMPKVEYLEKGFNLKISSSNNRFYTIAGKIDRIDRLPDGSIHIIDYKTGQSKDINYIDKKDKFQLYLYQMAAQDTNILGEKVGKLSYWYLRNNNLATFLGTDEDIQNLKDFIIKTIEEIQETDFGRVFAEHRCRLCDDRQI